MIAKGRQPSSDIRALRQDDQIANRDVARARQDEKYRIGHFLRLHQAARGKRLVQLLLRPVAEKCGDDRARGDGTDAQAMLGDLAPQCVDEGLDGMFRSRVNRFPDDGDHAGNRTRQDDIPGLALDHVRQDGMHRTERGVDVQIEHTVPGVGVAGQHLAADIGTGVGVENIQLACLRQDLRHHPRHAFRIREVDDQGNGMGTERRTDLLQCFFVAVDQHHSGAGGKHGLGAFQTDTRCGSGDGRDFSRQILSHFLPLLLSVLGPAVRDAGSACQRVDDDGDGKDGAGDHVPKRR
ncbi:hypothetical protein RHECNPAF_13600129 [Rhizobium etli CNPAF512]|nr:hypothetical protein RHECNPAF_13600129 [Rhizobium etli CNPAF512]